MEIVLVILILNEFRQKRHTAECRLNVTKFTSGKRVIIEVNDQMSDAAIHRYSYFPIQRNSELAWSGAVEARSILTRNLPEQGFIVELNYHGS